MHIDPNHKSGNAALNRAFAEIQDAFRPERKERKERKHTISQGCHVQEMVEAGRYSFPEACRLMNVSSRDVQDALHWLVDDNARMNALHGGDTHRQKPYHYMMAGWFQEQEKEQPVAQIIDFPVGEA